MKKIKKNKKKNRKQQHQQSQHLGYLNKPGGGRTPITPQLAAILERQRELFIEKFGREPGKGDLVFFDSTSDAPTPQPIDLEKMDADMEKALRAAGMRESIHQLPGETLCDAVSR